MFNRIFPLGFACALAPAMAVAQADRFRMIDRNHDGSISSEEWYAQQPAPVPFTMVDLDNDGKISPAEFRAWSAARGNAVKAGITTADRFRSIDRNKDNVISAAEWKDRFPFVRFETVDANRDHRISYQEFSRWDITHGGAGGAIATATRRGVAADLVAARLRTRDAMRGTVGVSAPSGLPGPAGTAPSSHATASVGTPGTVTVPRVTPETTAVTGIVSTSPGSAPGSIAPPLGTGSSLLAR